jgi:predicted transcriptional regulator
VVDRPIRADFFALYNRRSRRKQIQTEFIVDQETEAFVHISGAAQVRQRDISRILGMSLGMTNAVMKRLTHKGHLAIRKVNNRGIAYMVTPAGVEAIARRSYRYLRRTLSVMVYYRMVI